MGTATNENLKDGLNSKINQVDSKLCRAYLEKLQTQEYIDNIHEVNCEDERPYFSDDLIGMVRKAEATAQRSGDAQAVKGYIDACKKNVPAFAALFNDPEQESKQEPFIESINDLPNEIGFTPLPEAIRKVEELRQGASPVMDEYVALSKQYAPEAYEHYHSTCFLSMASTLAGRRVAIPFPRKEYTNLMCVLAGRSGAVTKTTATRLVEETIQKVGAEHMLIDSYKITPERFISNMARGYIPDNYGELPESEKEKVKRAVAMTAQRGWIYNEFGKFVSHAVKQNGYLTGFSELFLLLDDCPLKLGADTQARKDERAYKPYLSLLGTLTPASIKNNAKKNSELWSDGFWARMVFVTAPKNTYLDEPFKIGTLSIPDTIINPLKNWYDHLEMPEVEMEQAEDGKWSALRGELPETDVTFEDGVYNAWVAYRSTLKAMPKSWENEDLDASYVRLPTMAIRVAALLASLENDNRIELQHWAMAQHIAEIWRVSLHELYAWVNKTGVKNSFEQDLLEVVKKIDNTPIDARTIQRRSKRFSKEKAKDINEALRTFHLSGHLEHINGTSPAKYTLAK